MADSTISTTVKSQLLRALRWQYIANLGIGALGAVYIMVLAWLIGSNGFGAYAVLTATPTLIFNIFDFRMQEVLIYFHAQIGKCEDVTEQTVASAFAIDGIARLAGLITSFAMGLVVNWTMELGLPTTTVLLASIAVFVAKAGSGPAMGLLRVRERLNVFVLLQLCDWLLRLILLAALARIGKLSLEYILVTQCLSSGLINGIILWRATIEYLREFSTRLTVSWSEVVATVRMHWRTLGATQSISITDSVVKEADTIIVGYLLSVQASGFYKMAKNFASIAWRAADPVSIAIMPMLSQLWAQREFAKLNEFIRKMTILLFIASIVLFVISCIGVTIVVKYLLGSEYAASATIFPFAACWILAAMPLIWSHPLAIGAGAPGLQAKASAIGNLVGLAALYSGTLFFGLPGAAAGLSVAYALPFAIACVLLNRARIFAWSK